MNVLVNLLPTIYADIGFCSKSTAFIAHTKKSIYLYKFFNKNNFVAITNKEKERKKHQKSYLN